MLFRSLWAEPYFSHTPAFQSRKKGCIPGPHGHKRNRFAHKGNFGKAFLVAGSFGMMGAAVLASKACMKAGVGLLTVHGPESGYTIMQTSIPEVIFKPDKNPKIITLINDTSDYTAVGVGPGIGSDPNTVWSVRMLLKDLRRPCVIDADGLNIIASNRDLMGFVQRNSIMTPHPKEFDRLFGKSINGYDRLKKASFIGSYFLGILRVPLIF